MKILPVFNVPFASNGIMTPETYALLKSYYDTIEQLEADLTAAEAAIAALDVRIAALEP